MSNIISSNKRGPPIHATHTHTHTHIYIERERWDEMQVKPKKKKKKESVKQYNKTDLWNSNKGSN